MSEVSDQERTSEAKGNQRGDVRRTSSAESRLLREIDQLFRNRNCRARSAGDGGRLSPDILQFRRLLAEIRTVTGDVFDPRLQRVNGRGRFVNVRLDTEGRENLAQASRQQEVNTCIDREGNFERLQHYDTGLARHLYCQVT